MTTPDDYVSAKLRTVDLYTPSEDEVSGPTRHKAGTAERIAVYAARHARGLPIRHPSDTKSR